MMASTSPVHATDDDADIDIIVFVGGCQLWQRDAPSLTTRFSKCMTLPDALRMVREEFEPDLRSRSKDLTFNFLSVNLSHQYGGGRRMGHPEEYAAKMTQWHNDSLKGVIVVIKLAIIPTADAENAWTQVCNETMEDPTPAWSEDGDHIDCELKDVDEELEPTIRVSRKHMEELAEEKEALAKENERLKAKIAKMRAALAED
jgi:hypothetical protein